MSGILDSKTRVLDTLITLEGRKQLMNGGMNIKYVSFTDGSVVYKEDLFNSGSSDDATQRIQFEASNLPHDRITFGSNETGKVNASVESGLDISIRDGLINYREIQELTSSIKVQISDQILSSSINNFKKNILISNIDPVFDDTDFGLTPQLSSGGIEFDIRGNTSISRSDKFENTLVDIYRDPKFSNNKRYKFLPPISKTTDENIDKSNYESFKSRLIAQYAPWGLIGGEEGRLTIDEIFNNHLKHVKSDLSRSFRFDPTSNLNNIMIQGFDNIVNNEIIQSTEKIVFVDYGVHKTPKDNECVRILGITSDEVHVFFAGKFYKKETTSYSFVHLFTLFFG
jgi:hypothetical protein